MRTSEEMAQALWMLDWDEELTIDNAASLLTAWCDEAVEEARQIGLRQGFREGKPETIHPSSIKDVANVLQMIERAYGIVSELCAGRIQWTMRIPAQPDKDPNLIISRALQAASQKIDSLDRICQINIDLAKWWMKAAQRLSNWNNLNRKAARTSGRGTIDWEGIDDAFDAWLKVIPPDKNGVLYENRAAQSGGRWMRHLIYEAFRQSLEPVPEIDPKTRERDAAWDKCRIDREPVMGSDEWTVEEVGTYRGFFNLGWEAARSKP